MFPEAFGGGGLAQSGLISTDSLFLILAGILISIFASLIGAIVQFSYVSFSVSLPQQI